MRLQHVLAFAVLGSLISCDPPPTDPTPNGEPEPTPAAAEVKLTDTIALQGANGRYVTCEIAKPGAMKATLLCNRDRVGAWEKFTLVDLGDGSVALKAANGKFVTADRTRGNVLVGDRDAVGGWESFQLVDAGNGKKALKAASNGRFVTTDLTLKGDSLGLLMADRPEAHEWESFVVVAVGR